MAHAARCRSVLLATLLWLGAGPAGAAVDVNGTWRIDPGGALYVLEQNGTSLTVNVPPGGGLPGTIDPVTGEFSAGFSGGEQSVALDGLVLPGATRFVARTATFSPRTGVSATALTGTRCECDDGNTTDGDGCNSRCEIEPCYACSGTPSVCTRLPNGAACDDRNACTAGETCSAGTCGGGHAVVPCVNLTGRWFRELGNPEVVTGHDHLEIAQRGNVLELRSVESGRLELGIIEPATGAFDEWHVELPGIVCRPPISKSHGTTATGGKTFVTMGILLFEGPTTCSGQSFVETVARCGGGTLDAGEQCDDGNTTPGDGCDASCRLEGSGPCLGKPDGASCDDGDACTTGELCTGGVCGGGAARDCGLCRECDALQGCVRAAPRASCVRESTRSRLELHDGTAYHRSTLSWRWQTPSGGADIQFGDPLTTDDYAFCIFGPSGVVFRARANARGNCAGKRCWTQTTPTEIRYLDPARTPDGLTNMRLTRDSAAGAMIFLGGHGPELTARGLGRPGLPLAPPIVVQLQSTADGACFESTYGEDDIIRNVPGTLKARTR